MQGTAVCATSARDTSAWITTAQLPRGVIPVGATTVWDTRGDTPGPLRAFPVGAGGPCRAGWGSSRQGRAGQGRAGQGRTTAPRPRCPPVEPAPRRREPGAGSRGGGAGGGRRGGAAMGGAALSGALWLGLLWAGAGTGAGGGCSERCCEGRDAACVSSGWREDGGYGSCYCDGGCRRAGDCCHDHGQACPGRCGPRGGRLGFGPGQERGGFGEQAPRAAGLPAACWDVRGLVKGHGHRGWHQRQAEGRGEGLVVGSDSFWGLLCLGFAGWKLFSL